MLLGFAMQSCCFDPAQQGESAQRLGFQKRHGDEIMVCGQLYRIGTPVKLWLDPGGFDAYRTTRHFSPFEKREWKSTVEEMQSGKINFVTKPQENSPDRYGLRFGSKAQTEYTPEQLDQIRSGELDSRSASRKSRSVRLALRCLRNQFAMFFYLA